MKRVLTIISAIILLLSSGFGCQAQTQYVYAPKSKVNLRDTPSTSGAKAGMLQKFYPMPLIAETNGWYQVDDNGRQVFVSDKVSTICESVIPSDFFGQTLWTQEAPADELFYEGSMTITPKEDGKVAITTELNSMQIHAVCFVYTGILKDGVIALTHKKYGYFDGSEPLEQMLENADPLEKELYVGYDPKRKMVIFNGAPFGL